MLGALETVLKKETSKVWFGVTHEMDPDTFSKVTEWSENTNYSHVLSIYWWPEIQSFVFNASHGTGVQLDFPNQVLKEDKIVRLWEVDVNETQRLAYLRKTVELNGVDYSESQILKMAAIRILPFTKRLFKKSDDEMICSEYGNALSKTCGLGSAELHLGKPRDLLTHKDMAYYWGLLSTMPSYKKRIREIKINE